MDKFVFRMGRAFALLGIIVFCAAPTFAQAPKKPAVPAKPAMKAPAWPAQKPLSTSAPVRTAPARTLTETRTPVAGARNNGNRARPLESRLPDGRQMAAGHGREGVISGHYRYGNHEFARRTYYLHGRPYDHFYRGYQYHGVVLQAYAPVRYYPPAYYGWVYNPWVVRAPYLWGWSGAPWTVYYSSYFAPYPMYPSASLWLTDYLIANSLQARYQAAADAANGQPLPPLAGTVGPLTPDVKQLISSEVQAQVGLENSEGQQVAKGEDPDPASSGIERTLRDGAPHVFVAADDLSVIASSGQTCGLGQGDVVQVSAAPPADSTAVSALVLASKPQDCPRGAAVSLPLSALQEMHNYMREMVDQGLDDLRTKAGQGGLPPLSLAAQANPTTPPFAAIAPPPDPNAAVALTSAEPVQPALIGQAQDAVTDAATTAKRLAELASNLGGVISSTNPPANAPRDVPKIGAWSGTEECRGGPIPQNAEYVFHGLPAGALHLDYNKRIWQAHLVPGEGQTQKLILKNVGVGPQKSCAVHWITEN